MASPQHLLSQTCSVCSLGAAVFRQVPCHASHVQTGAMSCFSGAVFGAEDGCQLVSSFSPGCAQAAALGTFS